MDRRTLFGTGLGAMLGSFLIKDPVQLIVPEHKQIVLATDQPPEPLGYVTFAWAEVAVQPVDPRRAYYSYASESTQHFREELTFVNIQGVVEELHRDEAFFLAGQRGERLKLMFVKA